MLTLHQPQADIYIPDGTAVDAALTRTTKLAIGAHQDDLEFFAFHGIAACFAQAEEWFTGITVTNGAGSARTGVYERFSNEEMIEVRRQEQRKAAMLGEYSAMLQLDYPSSACKDAANEKPVEDLLAILHLAQPETVYLHNPADKHDTHIAVLQKCLAALRKLPENARPSRVYGCEVWRDLDWLPDDIKVALPVSDKTNLQAALNGVFDSQISGGKRYDLAVMGRRLAHATFYDSHSVDQETGLTFALDLTPLVHQPDMTMEAFLTDILAQFRDDVLGRTQKYFKD